MVAADSAHVAAADDTSTRADAVRHQSCDDASHFNASDQLLPVRRGAMPVVIPMFKICMYAGHPTIK